MDELLKKQIIHFSAFLNTPNRHGGTKRSEQISEEVAKLGIPSFEVNRSLKFSIIKSLQHPILFLESAAFSLYLLIFKGFTGSWVYLLIQARDTDCHLLIPPCLLH